MDYGYVSTAIGINSGAELFEEETHSGEGVDGWDVYFKGFYVSFPGMLDESGGYYLKLFEFSYFLHQ